MSKRRISSIVVEGGLCSAAVLFVAVAVSASTAPSAPHVAVDPSLSVDHSFKGDRLTHYKAFGAARSSIAVEMSGASDVVVRDGQGNVLFAVDSAARTTVVAKSSGRPASRQVTAPAERDLPEGCEGAFSPYAEPSMAGIVGRCVSSIFPQIMMVASASAV
jgi:hypothetical protein